MKETGYVHVYTGTGKGKTTAAMGLALRAIGRKKRVYVGQFLKATASGEISALKKFKGSIIVEQFGRKKWMGCKPEKTDVDLAQKGLDRCRKAMLSKKYNVVILDEINMAVAFHVVKIMEVLELLSRRPADVEMVLTGRNAPAEFLEAADLVTEMREIKHYYHKGVRARMGIEK
jgi:cob(I)alamin adenosyltransferase